MLRLTLTLTLILVSILGGCTGGRSPSPTPAPPPTVPPRSGGEVTVALVVRAPGNLDPARAAGPGERTLAANLFDGLTTIDREGRVQPATAASWSSDPAQRTWTFKLRSGAAFSDGAPVTAESFVTAWRRVATSPAKTVRALLGRVQGAAAFGRGGADQISGLAAPDPATLTVALTEPSADFPALAAEPSLAPVPRQALDDPAGFAARPVGNGPFVLAGPAGGGADGAEASRPGTAVRSLVLTRNPAREGGGAGPYLDRVQVLAVPDEQTAWLAFQEGRAQFAPIPLDQLAAAAAVYGPSEASARGAGVPGAGVAGAGAAASGGLVSGPEAAVDVLGFDLAAPPFGDRRARLGVALAIDRARLAARFSGARAPADALVPDGLRTVGGAACEPCGYDPARARTLLAEAGVEVVTLTVPAGAAGRTLAESLSADLKAAGVTVKVTRARTDPVTRPSGSGATLVTLLAPPGAASAGAFLDALYGDAGSAWPAGKPDQAVGDLLDQAAAVADEAARLRGARQAQDRLEAEALAIPLLEHRHHAAVAPGVVGLALTPSGLLDLAAVSLADPTKGPSLFPSR
jgi:oligopeptide transport system substrate-binding protein